VKKKGTRNKKEQNIPAEESVRSKGLGNSNPNEELPVHPKPGVSTPGQDFENTIKTNENADATASEPKTQVINETRKSGKEKPDEQAGFENNHHDGPRNRQAAADETADQGNSQFKHIKFDLISAKLKNEPDSISESLEEIAEDMLDLLKKIERLEETQKDIVDAVNHLKGIIEQSQQRQEKDLDKIRRELIGEHKTAAVRNVFNAVIPVIDSLKSMMEGLDPEEDSRMLQQKSAISSTLRVLIQQLGFNEFSVEIGETFDPNRMEILGYENANGENGRVSKMIRTGYQTSSAIVRPCGVLVLGPSVISDDEETQ
jgi:molecular chaperone GrpE (heat shock protein)